MTPDTITWVDGEWVEGNPPLLGPMSHSWWMASSVFDGARAFRGLIPDLDRHCARMVASAEAFHMKPPMSAGEMADLAWQGVERFPGDAELYIRPMMYFESGFITPDVDSSRFILTVFHAPLPAWHGVTACVSSYRRPTPEAAPTNAKASCLYPNVGRAVMEARSKGRDTAVVLDALGNIAEFAVNNLFLVKDGVVRTPAANGCFLAGLTRRRMIELLGGAGRRVDEATLGLDDLFAADEVFLTGNYSKILPVVRVAERDYQIGPTSTLARDLYFEFAEREGRRRG